MLKEFVPNLHIASIEDVLEIRYQLRAELEAFRASMAMFASKIQSNPWTPDIKQEIQHMVESDVRPQLSNLRASLRHSQLKVIKRALANLKNVKTYLPFLGTALVHSEPSIAALASAGLAGFQALYDTILERRKIRDENGLVFLLDARSSVAKLSKRRYPR